jgi:dolichyl-phosphate-mannose-protein mannosyltransferase
MSSPNSTLRHRGANKEKSKLNGKVDQANEVLDKTVEATKQAAVSQWEYKAALAVITLLSFLTRFWGISHPNEVVFDEVHFGKVCHYTPFLLAGHG